MHSLLCLAAIIALPMITPGPNNFIVMAQSVAGGVRRAIPSILAIAAGSAIMMTVAIRFVTFAFVERTQMWIGIAGSFFLAVMTIQQWLAADRPLQAHFGPSRSLALIPFQWVNPKSWVLAVIVATAASTAGVSSWLPILLLVTISIASSLLWALLGGKLSRLASDPTRGLWLRRAMAAALLLATIQLLLSQFGVLL